MKFIESLGEATALAWLESLGYTLKHGSEIAPGEQRIPDAQRIFGKCA